MMFVDNCPPLELDDVDVETIDRLDAIGIAIVDVVLRVELHDARDAKNVIICS